MPGDIITSADRGGVTRRKARRAGAVRVRASAIAILAIGGDALAFSPSPRTTFGRPISASRSNLYGGNICSDKSSHAAAAFRQPLAPTTMTSLGVAQTTENLVVASTFADDLAAKVRLPDDEAVFGKQHPAERNGEQAGDEPAFPDAPPDDDAPIVPEAAALVLKSQDDAGEIQEEEIAAAPPSNLPSDSANPLPAKLFNALLLSLSFGFALYTVLNVDHGMTRGWTPSEITMRIPIDNWSSYENSLSSQPVATKTIINVVIYLLGDWLSQTVFQKKDVLDFDAVRTLRNGFIGLCFGPLVHEYYEFSDFILPVDVGINRIYKIFMDQTVYLFVKCSLYIIAVGTLSGQSFGEAKTNAQDRIVPIMFTAWKFWPLVHCVTYGLIPARHRILWVNSVDLIWNAILAGKTSEDKEVVADGADAEGEELLVLEGANGAVAVDGEDAGLISVVMASEGANGVSKVDEASHHKLELVDDDSFEDAADGGLARQKVLNGTAPFVE